MMLHRPVLLSMILAASCTSTALPDESEARPNEVPGWGRVIDPWRDCDVSLDRENERLKIQVPGTPHVLSAEVPRLPMNAPLVLRRVRGDFTADVRVLGRFEPGPFKTTHYDPYHGAGLIVWQDPSNYLRLERAVGTIKGRHHPYVNYELRAGGRLAVSYGFTIEDGSLYLKLRRQGSEFSAWYSHDGRRWTELRQVDADFAQQVEVGVVAVNSSKRTLSAELEMFNVEDPQGSRARDYADHDTEVPPPPPPGLPDGPQVPPRPASALQGSMARDFADHATEASSASSPASKDDPRARPRRTSVLFDPSPTRKPPIKPPAPKKTVGAGFQW